MSPRRKVAMPTLLIRFWVGLLVLTGLSAVYTVILTLHYHSEYPWDVQFLWGPDFSWDFLVFRDRFLHFRAPDFWQIPGLPFTYPATLGVAFGILYKFAHPVRVYLGLCATGLLAWAIWFVRSLAAKGVAQGPAAVFVLTIAATSWPVWILVDTSNIEGLVAIFLGSGILAFVYRRCWLAAALIGIAGAMKIFPLALLALLLSKRRYREFTGGIVIAIAVTLVSLSVMGPSITEAQRHINSGLRLVTTVDAYALTSPGPDTNHSLYTVVRYAVLLAHHIHPHTSAPQPERDAAILLPVYDVYLVLGGIAAIAVYFLRLRRLPILNQILAITVYAVMFPPLSRDYSLLQLLVPLGLLCIYAAMQTQHVPGLVACFACYAVILSPVTFLSFGLSLTSQFRAFTLLALFVLLLKYPFAWASLDTAARAGANDAPSYDR